MEINRIRQFATLVSTSNLRRSSEILGITPGALSKSLKVLQDEIGLQLFEPSGRGLVITPAGKEFFENSKSLLNEFDFFQEKTQSLNSAPPKPVIKISSYELFSTYVFTKLANQFDANSRFTLIEKIPGEIEKSLLAKESDYGFTTQPVPDPQLDFLRACSFSSGIFIAKNHGKTFDLPELVFSSPLSSLPTNPLGQTQLDNWPLGIPRKIHYRVELLETGLGLARIGKAAIYCPRFIAKIHNLQVKEEFTLKEIPTPKKFKASNNSVYLVKRKNDPENSISKKLTTHLRLLCKD